MADPNGRLKEYINERVKSSFLFGKKKQKDSEAWSKEFYSKDKDKEETITTMKKIKADRKKELQMIEDWMKKDKKDKSKAEQEG